MLLVYLLLLAMLLWGVALLIRPNLLRRIPFYYRWVYYRWFDRGRGSAEPVVTDTEIRYYAGAMIFVMVVLLALLLFTASKSAR